MTTLKGTGDPTPAAATRLERNTVGALILAAGILGLFVPVLQAILMVAAGIALLDLPQKERAHRALLQWQWYQWLAQRGQRLREWWRARAG